MLNCLVYIFIGAHCASIVYKYTSVKYKFKCSLRRAWLCLLLDFVAFGTIFGEKVVFLFYDTLNGNSRIIIICKKSFYVFPSNFNL